MTRAIKQIAIATLVAVSCRGAQSAIEDGIAAFHRGEYSTAAAKLNDAKDERGRVFYALSQAAQGNCRDAVATLSGYSGPDVTLNRLAGIAAAKCYSALGQTGNAFEVLARLQRQFPKDADVLYTTAKLHMKAFNDATLAMFQRAPASYRVHELSAEIFEIDHRYGEAIAEYRKAIELNPQAPDLHFRLGRAILLQGHDPRALDEAAREFQAELKLSPEDGACEFQLGQISQVKGNAAEAKAHFQRAIALSPDFVQALVALGKQHAREKNYQEAIALLTRATRAQPTNESAHYALMTAYRDSGQMEQAKSEKATLDKLAKPPEGEFTDFLKKIGEKPPEK